MKKKILAVILSAAMALSLAACTSSAKEENTAADTEAATEAVTESPEAVTEAVTESAEETTTEEVAETETETDGDSMSEGTEEEETAVIGDLEDVEVRIGALSGPTAMGMVKLMSDSENGETAVNYTFEIGSDASTFVAPLAKGELDIACIPSNLASVVYNNTEGAVEVLATCNLGVLNLVEKGESLTSLEDLAGKTIYMTGQGAVPEAVVRYLLNQAGIDPDKDLTLTFCADANEALAYIAQTEDAIAVLPQPFVTAACAKIEGLRVVLDLNDAWAACNNGCDIITGVVVARKEFVEANPNTVAQFLQDYEASVAYTTEDAEGAAALIESYGIVAKAAIAQKALPSCHLTVMTGEELKTSLSGFLQILADANAQSVGGQLPGDDFYYGAE